ELEDFARSVWRYRPGIEHDLHNDSCVLISKRKSIVGTFLSKPAIHVGCRARKNCIPTVASHKFLLKNPCERPTSTFAPFAGADKCLNPCCPLGEAHV